LRRVGWIVTGLVGLVWLIEELPAPKSSPQPGCATSWRRTNDGWERLETIVPPSTPSCPALHPSVLASAQALLSLLALIAWGSAESQENRRRDARNSRQAGL
jgi:hypothetical protein